MRGGIEKTHASLVGPDGEFVAAGIVLHAAGVGGGEAEGQRGGLGKLEYMDTKITIEHGDLVYLETKIGKIKARLNLTEAILPGVIWTPSHPAPATPIPGNSGETVNTIVPYYWDKVSAQFNGFGCRLRKVGGATP